jgi:hypothetical protein
MIYYDDISLKHIMIFQNDISLNDQGSVFQGKKKIWLMTYHDIFKKYITIIYHDILVVIIQYRPLTTTFFSNVRKTFIYLPRVKITFLSHDRDLPVPVLSNAVPLATL